MAGKDDTTVLSTGRDIDSLVQTLIETADDKNGKVTESFIDSLSTIGRKQPELVVSASCAFLIRNIKLPVSHRTVLLTVIHRVLNRVEISQLNPDLVNRVIRLAVNELTASKEVIPEWQTAASEVLVALARVKCVEVISDLLTKVQPGVLPHFFVIETLGKIAVVNPFTMVQHMSTLLPSFLPLLGLAKGDSMRWVFCTALTRFAESVLDYVANLDRAPDKTVHRTSFAADVYAAYDVLLSGWLSAARDVKLQLAIIECIGALSQLLSEDKLDEQCARLSGQLVNLLKKHNEAPRVAQALANALESCALARASQLDTQLEPLCTSIITYLTVSPDFSNQNAVKFHNELLRCFAILCHVNVSRVVTFLLQRLEQNNVQLRMKMLIVLRHVVNFAQAAASEADGRAPASAAPKLSVTLGNDEKHRILGAFRVLFTDPQTYAPGSNKLRKVAAHCVIALADHSFMHLEGSRYLVEFIVRQCATSTDEPERPRKEAEDSVSNAELKALADNILHSFSSRLAHQLLPVLWPYLLEFFCAEPYTLAMPALCKALVHLNRPLIPNDDDAADDAADDATTPDDVHQSLDSDSKAPSSTAGRVSLFAEIDYEMHPNVPKAPMLMARLFSLLGAGSFGSSNYQFGSAAWRTQTEQLLLSMSALAYVLHPDLVPLFQTVVPKLVRFLHAADASSGARSRSSTTGGETKTDERVWSDLVLKLLAKALELLSNETSIVNLGDALLTQITTLYTKPIYVAEKCFAMRCVGVLLRVTNSREFAGRALDTVFNATLHNNKLEREACAVCVGYCAASIISMDLALQKLEIWLKQDAKKSGGVLSLLSDKSADQSALRCTVVLCYGYVVQYAPRTITTRVDTNVVVALNPLLQSAKDPQLKESLVRAISKIAATMQQAGALAVSGGAYAAANPADIPTFSRRLDLVHNLLVFVSADPRNATHEFKLELFNALRALALCDPFLPDGDLETLFKATLDCLMQSATVTTGVSGKSASKTDESQAQALSADAAAKLSELTDAYCGLLTALLLKHVGCFAQVLAVLKTYIPSANESERRVALATLGACLRELERQNVPELLAAQTSKWAFQEFGQLVGLLVPRCADPSLSVRDAACGALLNAYSIIQSMTYRVGESRATAADECSAVMGTIREKLQKQDASVMFSAVNDLGNKVICKRTPTHHLISLVDTLIDSLLDEQSSSAAAACVVLNCMFKQQATELGNHLDQLLTHVHDSLLRLHAITDAVRRSETEKIRVGAYRALRTLATKYLVAVVQFILKQPLPYDEVWVETLSTLARDNALAQASFDLLLDALSRAQPFEEQPASGRKPPVRAAELRKPTPDRDVDDKDDVPLDFWLELPARRTTWPYLAHLTALRLMLTVEETESLVCGAYFERLLTATLLALACSVGTEMPKTPQPDASISASSASAGGSNDKNTKDKDKAKEKEKEKEKDKDKARKGNVTAPAEKLEPLEVAYELYDRFITRAKLIVLNESIPLSQSPVVGDELQAHFLLHSKSLGSELLAADVRGKFQKLNAIIVNPRQLEPGCDTLVEAGSFIDAFGQLMQLTIRSASLPACLQIAAAFYSNDKDKDKEKEKEKEKLEYTSFFAYYQKTVQCVQPYVHSPFVLYRFAVCCLMAQLCSRGRSRSELNWLNQSIVTPLLGMLEERHVFVRQLVVRGFSNLALLRDARLRERALSNTGVLTALLTALDSHDDIPSVTLTVEACNALLQILEHAKFAQVRLVLMNLAVKVRACFELSSSRVRAASISLFSATGSFAIAREGDADTLDNVSDSEVAEFRAQFAEQLQTNFVTFILHLNEVNSQVSRSCKLALRQLSPLLSSPRLAELITSGLTLDSSLHYGEFLNDLSKLLVLDCADRVAQFVMNCVQQFKNVSPRIRANAALFCGFLLGAYLALMKHFNLQPGNVSRAVSVSSAAQEAADESEQSDSPQFVFGSGLFKLPEGEKLALLKERLVLVNVTRSHIAGALVLLVKEDKNADVRIRAAEAVSYLHAL